jgi:hypothetical protein
VKLTVGCLPHVFASQTKAGSVLSTPVTYWGALNPAGHFDEIPFRAQAGQTVVFDLAAQSIGSKLNAHLTLLDAGGRVLASQGEFDNGDPCSRGPAPATAPTEFAWPMKPTTVRPIIFTACP